MIFWTVRRMTAERRYLINYFLDQFKSTMFRQTMFAEFERDTHAAVQCGRDTDLRGTLQCVL